MQQGHALAGARTRGAWAPTAMTTLTRQALRGARSPRPRAERIFYVAEALRRGWSVERVFELTRIDPVVPRPHRRTWSPPRARIARAGPCRHGRRRTCWPHKQMGFSDAQIGHAHRPSAKSTVRAVPQDPGRAPTGQDRGHLRRPSSPARTSYHYNTYERGETTPSSTRPPQARWSSSRRAAPTASARASSSTTAACHAAYALARRGLRDHHGQLQPRDRLHRLRHLRPPLLRAAYLRGRAWTSSRSRSPTASSCTLGGQTPLKLAKRARGRRACPSWAPSPRPSTWPRTATASRACSTSWTSPTRRSATAETDGRGQGASRRTHRLPAARPSELRAGRSRHGHRLR